MTLKRILVVSGLLLLAINLVGLVLPSRPAWVEKEAGLFEDDITLTEAEAFAAVQRLPGEGEAQYGNRLTMVIRDAMFYPRTDVPEAWIQPTDGWLLWLAAQTGRVNPTSFADWRKNLARGVGGCSQHAHTLVGLLSEQGIEAYVVTRLHHVYATAKLDGEWWVLDPTYGVTLHGTVAEVQRDPERIRAAYEEAAARQTTLFDNEPALDAAVRVMTDEWAGLSTLPVEQEQRLLAAGWVLPLLLIAFGLIRRR